LDHARSFSIFSFFQRSNTIRLHEQDRLCNTIVEGDANGVPERHPFLAVGLANIPFLPQRGDA
jgi:hypothetical protein